MPVETVAQPSEPERQRPGQSEKQTSDAIVVRDLVYEVPEKRILSDVNLNVGKGEVLAIMGKSGSGKTTLLKCLAGLIKPTSGRVELFDQNIAPLSESELDDVRLKIGLVFQYAALFDSLSVYDNVAFGVVNHRRIGRRETSKIVADRLAEVGMEGTEKLFPSQLSGGMQKRVGLARALAMEPSVLLYDEPTSGLDPVIAHSIDDLIVETRNRLGMTSVVVSHDIASIFRIADRIAMVDEGAIIAAGTPDEIRASSDSKVKEFVTQE
jgi:phospholipid/cholesterol/gamma-HCH transport system ATP-binding protein